MQLAQLLAQLLAAGPAQAVVELLLGGGIGGQLAVEQLAQVPVGGRQGGRGAAGVRSSCCSIRCRRSRAGRMAQAVSAMNTARTAARSRSRHLNFCTVAERTER